jgi:glutamate synthase domain-containing protein 3
VWWDVRAGRTDAGGGEIVIEGQGFRFESDALYAFADAGTALVDIVDEIRTGLGSAGELPAGIFGEVGQSSGFVAAYGERVRALGTAVDSVGRGVDGLSTAVRTYVDAKLQQEDDTAVDLRQVGERV